MVCKTVKPTVITETDREKVSYPSKCFYFTCIVEVIYNTFLRQEKEEKKQYFQNTKKEERSVM